MITTYKTLGLTVPAAVNTPAELYVTPAATQTIVSTLVIVNTTSSNVQCGVFWLVTSFETAGTNNALAYNMTVPANGRIGITEGWTLYDGNIIQVQSNVASALTFTLFGSEIG